MVFLFRFFLIGIICFLTGIILPWWSIIVFPMLISFFIPGNNFNVFLSGFLSISLLWLIMAWKVDIENDSIISSKIVQLFPLDDTSMLIVATGFVGGIVGGFSSFTGNSFRQIFIKKKKKSLYA